MRLIVALLLCVHIAGLVMLWYSLRDPRIMVAGCLIADKDKHEGEAPFFEDDPTGWRGHVRASDIIGFQEFSPNPDPASLDCARVFIADTSQYVRVLEPKEPDETSADALKRILDRR